MSRARKFGSNGEISRPGSLEGIAVMQTLWLILGFVGQSLFATRFVVQWISSERLGRSHIPIAFWYLSISGSLIMLAYAIHIKDPVVITGYVANSFVYARNLMLIWRPRSTDA